MHVEVDRPTVPPDDRLMRRGGRVSPAPRAGGRGPFPPRSVVTISKRRDPVMRITSSPCWCADSTTPAAADAHGDCEIARIRRGTGSGRQLVRRLAAPIAIERLRESRRESSGLAVERGVARTSGLLHQLGTATRGGVNAGSVLAVISPQRREAAATILKPCRGAWMPLMRPGRQASKMT